ncbi:hypothetical protein [Kitasatospora sp. NPDC050463]|uniref:hypothetical protein n=1 Tax=Kitasatospora sp. NPDC050463 TaxID=3155786 RepID=UPI0033DAF255
MRALRARLTKPLAAAAVTAALLAGGLLWAAPGDTSRAAAASSDTAPPATGSPTAAPTAERAQDGDPAAVVQASAQNASGCTPASYGMVCGVVKGKALRVDTAHIARDKVWPEAICDYEAVLTVYNSKGSKIHQQRSPRHGGCSMGRAWFDLDVRKSFPNNSKIALSFYERGVHQGTTSYKITR